VDWFPPHTQLYSDLYVGGKVAYVWSPPICCSHRSGSNPLRWRAATYFRVLFIVRSECIWTRWYWPFRSESADQANIQINRAEHIARYIPDHSVLSWAIHFPPFHGPADSLPRFLFRACLPVQGNMHAFIFSGTSSTYPADLRLYVLITLISFDDYIRSVWIILLATI